MISYDQLGLAFQARHIAVPMSEAYCVDPHALVREALSEMRKQHFDQAPVKHEGKVTGFVLEHRLALVSGDVRVGEVEEPIGQGNMVSADAPVGVLLDWIISPGLLFVIDGREITGFVTVSDFNRQAARAYFYLLIATLETVLAAAIRARFVGDQEQALELLAPQQAKAVRDRYDADIGENLEADHVAYLTFTHLLRVALREPAIRARLGSIAEELDGSFGEVVKTRNRIMHPTQSLVTRKASAMRLRTHERLMRDAVVLLEAPLA